MGLDTVEIVLWAETEFQIDIPDADAQQILTVGEFSRYIAEKSAYTYDSVLQKVTNFLVQEYNVPLDKISASSRFVKDLGLD